MTPRPPASRTVLAMILMSAVLTTSAVDGAVRPHPVSLVNIRPSVALTLFRVCVAWEARGGGCGGTANQPDEPARPLRPGRRGLRADRFWLLLGASAARRVGAPAQSGELRRGHPER